MEKPNELKLRFKHHIPDEEKIAKYENVRQMLLDVALLLNEMCPDSREKSLMFTHLEEAMFWANASIARRVNM